MPPKPEGALFDELQHDVAQESGIENQKQEAQGYGAEISASQSNVAALWYIAKELKAKNPRVYKRVRSALIQLMVITVYLIFLYFLFPLYISYKEVEVEKCRILLENKILTPSCRELFYGDITEAHNAN